MEHRIEELKQELKQVSADLGVKGKSAAQQALALKRLAAALEATSASLRKAEAKLPPLKPTAADSGPPAGSADPKAPIVKPPVVKPTKLEAQVADLRGKKALLEPQLAQLTIDLKALQEDVQAVKAKQTALEAEQAALNKTSSSAEMNRERAVRQVERGEKAVRVVMESRLKAIGQTVDSWFAGLEPDATFLGHRITPSRSSSVGGVHTELASKLREAEAALVRMMNEGRKKPKTADKDAEEAPDLTLDDVAKMFKIHDISGLRPPSIATGSNPKDARPSNHCMGLAVDINCRANPFFERDMVTPWYTIDTAVWFVLGQNINSYEGLGEKNVGGVWDKLNNWSTILKRYMEADPSFIKRRVEEIKADKSGTQARLSKLAADAAYAKKRDLHSPMADPLTDEAWAERIKLDTSIIRVSAEDVKSSGIMDLSKELVLALTGAGLTWGACYGTEVGKDIQHFDYRKGSLGGAAI